jgi:hypothetical protein
MRDVDADEVRLIDGEASAVMRLENMEASGRAGQLDIYRVAGEQPRRDCSSRRRRAPGDSLISLSEDRIT